MSGRGELRIYLGAAPGVGKTYTMLAEARRRAERGTDVVVGLVETQGRAGTEALLPGLSVLPVRSVTDNGVVCEEVDVAAVLARAPQVVLVDNLAHRNPPGSTHAHRWQDVEALRAAGITVLTTLNVEHLESLHDVVEQITGVPPRGGVPDEVVRRAEQVELVDITPEALRRRLAHGNIYGPEQVDAAMADYFAPGKLSALRELALRWMADQVEDTMVRHRGEAQLSDPWETRERVVVALTGGPESETVLRRAARIAQRSGSAPMLGVHVQRGAGQQGAAPADTLSELRRLAEHLGASFHTVVGDDIAAALLEFARGANATQLVLGTSRRSRLAHVLAAIFTTDIGARVVADSGPLDIHLVTHIEPRRGLALPRHRSAVPLARRMLGWALGMVLPLAATGIGVAGRSVIELSTDVVLFFLATVLTALVGGLGPALLAAIASGLLLNYFLTAPLYTFTISARENVITLMVMVIVAVLVALVVDRAARRAQQAARAGTEAALLASFSRTVLTRPDPLPQLLDKVRETFALTSVAVLEHRDGRWSIAAHAGPPDSDHTEHPDRADVDIAIDAGTHLIGHGRALPAADRRLLEAVGGQALLALRNQQITTAAAEADRRAQANELRTALLSAVGHDLRTPLTAIKASAASLRDPDLPLTDTDRAELAATVEESADRLTALVANLLDSSRIATGAIAPDLHPLGYDEVVAHALTTVDDADRVVMEIDAQLPEVLADPGLLDRVIANLVDNALRHGAGAPVALRASAHAERVELRVIDSGPGVPPGDTTGLFTPFQRLGDRAGGGLGLGLSVARGFTAAMGGTLTAEDTPGGGLTVVISLPVARPVADIGQPGP